MDTKVTRESKGCISQTVDVICQHSRDGMIMPIKVRVKDEEGEFQSYVIKSYKDVSHQGSRTMPDGMYVSDRTLIFECQIKTFDRYRMIRLYYEPAGTIWKMTV